LSDQKTILVGIISFNNPPPMRAAIRWITGNRLIVLTILGAATVLLGLQIRHLTIDSDILSSLPDDDPIASLYLEIGDEFGSNDMAMVVLEADDIFTAEMIGYIDRIIDTLRYAEGVSSVTGLVNVLDIKSSEWGIEVGALIDEYALPETQEEIDYLRNYVMSKEMYRGVLVSEDGKATVIMVNLLQDIDHKVVARGIRELVDGVGFPGTISFGGLPMMMDDVNRLIIEDVIRLIPLVFLVICLILFLSFRTIRGTLLPLLTAGMAVVWTLGLMALTGYSLTVISNIIPVVLLAIGSAYTIHVLNSIMLHSGGSARDRVIRGVQYIVVPVVLASVTTAVGFVSFIFGAYLTMIRDFGLFTAVGTLIALLLALVLVPALVMPRKGSHPTSSSEEASPSEIPQNTGGSRWVNRLVGWITVRPIVTVSVWGFVMLVCITGITMLTTSVNMTHYFKPGFPTRVAEDLLQEKFGGSMPVFVLFEGDIHDPEVLQLMSRTENFMKRDPNITFTQSVAGLIEQMNDAMEEGLQIPDERAKVDQLWFLLDGQEVVSQLVNRGLDRAIIQSRFASVDSHEMEAFTTMMEGYVAGIEGGICDVSITGMPMVYGRLNDSLIRSQVNSLLIALGMVLLLVSLILKSFRYGLFATVPVAATVVILLGFMGLTSIPIDVATVLVASVAMGIGIDYAIHIVSGFRRNLDRLGEVRLALEQTLFTSGRAVLINLGSVSAGFLLLVFSQIVPLQYFGLLIAVSMIGSGLGSLTLLPALLLIANRKYTKRSPGKLSSSK